MSVASNVIWPHFSALFKEPVQNGVMDGLARCLSASLTLHPLLKGNRTLLSKKKGPTSLWLFSLRNLSKCTLLCWIIAMVQMKENLQQIIISIFLFLCGALNSVDTRQHKEIYCNRYQVWWHAVFYKGHGLGWWWKAENEALVSFMFPSQLE